MKPSLSELKHAAEVGLARGWISVKPVEPPKPKTFHNWKRKTWAQKVEEAK